MLSILMSFAPVLCLLICLLVLKMSAKRAGAWSFLLAGVIYITYFQSGKGVAVSVAKGFGLALFVVLIIWGAMLLYNLVKETGALDVINRNIQLAIEDRMLQFLFLSWGFSSFLQGIAGFGVPVIVVTPILIGMGFSPAASAAAVLIGHSWSISFGSMGSSIYAINMVTNTGIEKIVIYMVMFGIFAMLCTGISVCFLFEEKRHMLKGVLYVLITSVFMGLTLYGMAKMEMFSIIGLSTGAVGLLTLFVINQVSKLTSGQKAQKRNALYKNNLSLGHAVLPYLLIATLSIFFFFLKPEWAFNLSYPGYETIKGVTVAAETDYVTFNLLKFPFSVIVISAIISGIVFWKMGALNRRTMKRVMDLTVKKCVSTSVTIVFLLATAVIMMDSKMIENLAYAAVSLSRDFYPVLAPFIGLLGAFITGSNTNSNIIFGNFQELAAGALGLNAAVMCAAQSVGASIGGAIGPTTVSLGAAAAHIQGEESSIYRKTLCPILMTALVLGLANQILFFR